MNPHKVIPFFAELGLLLNLIRVISSAMNEESGESYGDEDEFSNVRYIRHSSFKKLQTGFTELENEVAYFFTEKGTRKASDSVFDSQRIHRKLVSAFKGLSSEYFTMKSGHREKIPVHQNSGINIEASIYKITRQRPAVVN